MSRFEAVNGIWNDEGWWNNANTVEALCNTMIYTEAANLTDALAAVYSNQPATEIITAAYNDDVMWWSLGWARAYELTSMSFQGLSLIITLSGRLLFVVALF